MDGQGNISVNAPNRISMTCTDMDINVTNNKTISVGSNMTTSVGMNKTNSVSANHTETIGAMKNTTVAMDMMTMVTGKLTEVIEGDVHSETKSGKTSVSSGKGMDLISTKNLNKHSEKEIQINSTEKSKQH
ncbi:bacteriophage T4 gp5 trimerisation domain-containing protein [Flavobacterium columnare]|uniref:bacteriophage T4 gp5 trimerisation domain-containing protein n=1 Tax=Flavobacterium columnare TaxID=996 RepID=UPI00197A979A|nr:hypothetical protein [Flavobacterium columnare]